MKKITASILSVLMMLSMVFSSSVFAANEQPSAWESFVGLFSTQATTATTGVEYRGHIQNIGNYPTDPTQWVQGPNRLGTVGQNLRLEGFWIQLTNKPANVNIQYRVHVQNVGWMAPVKNGNFAGTEGKSQRIEAIEISLVDDNGNAVTGYSVQYKGHIQDQGDTAWFTNGQQLGTTGLNRRLEALEVKIVQTKADMTAYTAAVTQAGTAKEADYTTTSFAALTKALADNVVTDADTQVRVDAATAAINTAFAGLVKGADLTAYNAIVDKSKAVDKDLFTTASYADLTKALADNVVTKDSSAAQVTAATTAITTAFDALVAVADMDAYDAAVLKAKEAKEADYTATTFAALTKALADNVVTDQDTQAKVDAATVAINGAYDGLVKIVKITSVSAINTTTVEVVLTEVPATDYADADAAKFVVKENGNDVTVTAVAKRASDLTGKTYRLTVTTLAGKQGTLSVNGTEAVVPAGMVYPFDFKAPDVTSIVAKGTTTVEVTFSEKLDPAAANIATANFTVLKNAVANTTNTAVLDATGTKVTLSLGTPLTVADYVLKLGAAGPVDVKDVAGNGIFNGTEINFRPTAAQLEDLSAPSIVAATYNKETGALALTFSKNILDSTLNVSKLSINGTALTGATVTTGTANDNQTSIALTTAQKTTVNAIAGALTLTSAKDAYGDATKLTPGETVNIAKQEPAKIASGSYVQETNILTVTFDKAVTLETATTLTVGDNSVTAAITKAMAVKADGTAADTTVAAATWTFDATTVAATIEGMTTANLKAYMVAGAVKNEAGVLNADTQTTYATGVAVTYTADVTKPVLASVVYNNNTDKFTLTFSEKVNVATLNAAVASIQIWDANAHALTNFASLTGEVGTAVPAGTTAKTIEFDLSGAGDLAKRAALETAFNTGKTVKVTLAAGVAVDEASLQNVATTYATGNAVTYNDYDAPILTGTASAANKNLVILSYNEPLDEATATNAANYKITDSTATVLAITKATLQAVATDGTQQVYLTTATQTADAPYTVTVTNMKDVAKNIKDTATATFNGSTAVDVAALTVDTLVVTAPINSQNDTLTVGFNTAPDSALATNPANYVVLQADADTTLGWTNATLVSLTNATAKMVSGQPTKAEITLANSSNLQTGKYYKVIASNVTTVTGKALGTTVGDNFAVSAQTSFAAPAAPVITEANTTTGAVKLVFGEELTAAATTTSNYTVAGNTVTNATYTWDAVTKLATVTLDLNTALTTPTNVGLTQTSGVTNIKNLAGVGFASATITAPAALTDNVAPTVDTIVAKTVSGVNNDVITITFKDNDLLAASAGLAANYVVKDPSSVVIPATKYTVAFVDGGLGVDKVTITFNDPPSQAGTNVYNLQYGQNYTVTAKDVVDTSGNKLAETTKIATWDASSDKTAPTLTGNAVIDLGANTATVTFDETVDSVSANTLANYTVIRSTSGSFTGGADETTLTPIFMTFNGTTSATITVADFGATVGSKIKVSAINVKDLAGNTITTASSVVTLNATSKATTPAAPTVTKKAGSVVTEYQITTASTNEWSVDGTHWATGLGSAQDVTIPLTGATVSLRVKATSTVLASDASTKAYVAQATAPTAPTVTKKAGSVVTEYEINTANTNEWSLDGTTWTTGTGGVQDVTIMTTGATVSLRVKATDNVLASAASTKVYAAQATAPTAPTVTHKAADTTGLVYEITTAATNEWSVDGTTWTPGNTAAQDVNIPTAGATVRLRVKATNDVLASASSTKVYAAQVTAPNVTLSDSTSATTTFVGATTAMEYSIDGGTAWTTWASGAQVDASGANNIVVRVKATDTVIRSTSTANLNV